MAFSLLSENRGRVAIITLTGELDASVAGQLREAGDKISHTEGERPPLRTTTLCHMATAAPRGTSLAQRKTADGDLYLVRRPYAVLEKIAMTGFHHSVLMVHTYEPAVTQAF